MKSCDVILDIINPRSTIGMAINLYALNDNSDSVDIDKEATIYYYNHQ